MKRWSALFLRNCGIAHRLVDSVSPELSHSSSAAGLPLCRAEESSLACSGVCSLLVRCVHSPGGVCCADYRAPFRHYPRLVRRLLGILTPLRRYPHPTSAHLSDDFGVAFGQHRGVCRRLPRICPRGTEVPFAETVGTITGLPRSCSARGEVSAANTSAPNRHTEVP